MDSAGNVYVADTGNHSIRKVDTGGNVTTIAGDGTAGFNDANGVSAHFNAPRGVAVDSSGRVYVADTGNHAVRRIEASGNVFTIAGNGTVGSSNGTGTAARFNGLAGITVDGQTVYVYIADTGNHQIRRLDTSAAVILLAGLDRGFKDGTAAQSRFADPVGIAADGAGHIVIAETTNSLVREVDPLLALNAQPNAVYTLAGTGGRGTTNGAGDIAQFNKPGGVAILTSSTVIVADTGNNALRKILLPPVIASLNPTQGNSGTAITITGNRFDERGPSYNTVRFTTSSGTVNATVTTVTRSQINVTVPSGAVTGNVTVQTAGGTSNGVTFTVITTQPPAIADFNPKSGSIGTLVTITGTNLKVGATDPVVSFQGPNSTRLPAAISSATATQVIAIVPNGAVTGLIDLTTSLGTAITASAFIVQLSQDYSLTLAPSSQTTMQGSQAVYIVSATSPQSDFTQLIKLSISGLPSGMQDKFKFEPAQITAGGNSTLTLTVPDSQSPTSYSFTVQGLASLDGNSVARTAGGSLTVMNRNGQTTLSGRVLGTDDKPIMGAHVFIGSATDTTNAAGSFLLTGVAASPPGGQSVISIDATSIIGLPTETYPFINEPAVILSGQANISSYNFYLPRIDWGNSGAVNNLDTSSAPAIITNSNVPGLKMTIPQGVQLIGRNGSAITRASITPVPIDRVPAPLPAEITLVQGQPPVKISTPLVYTSQPGSATVANGAKVPITYPNLGGASPGTVVPLFNFDHADVTWKKYGDGQVSTDGKTIVPINGAGLSDFSWHFPFTGVGADPNDPDCGNHVQTPVDLSTGHKLEIMTDVAFGGARGGISLTRIFTNDLSNPSSTVNTRFGHGMSDNFNIRLFGNYAAGAVRVILPDQMDGRLFTFDSAQGGTRIYKTTATISQLGDVVRWPSDNAQPEYRTKAGTVLRFEQQPGAPQNYRLTTITDRNGNVTTLTYTGNDLTTIKDAVNRELHLTYVSLQDGLGGQMRRYVDTVTDPLNRVTRYYYEYKSDTARWLLRSVVDPLGFTISYTYNRYNWISSVKDARGNFAKRIEYYYVDGIVDPRNNGRVRWQIFADGRKETYQYSYAAQVVTGVKIRSYPNSLPDTTPDDDPQVRVMTRRFNARGYMIAATDALGQPSVIERNVENNLPTQTTGACGCPESSRTFDAKGNVLAMTNQVGSVVGFEYDANFNSVSKITLPDAGDGQTRVSNFAYDPANGNLSSITNALGDITTFGYDPAASSLLKTITTPAITTAPTQAASVTTLNYDANGFLHERLDPLNHKITFDYDVVGRLKKMTDHLGRYTEFAYDDSDRLIEVKTPDTDPATGLFRQTSTTYAYDQNGNRTLITDAFGKQWQMSYDGKNRLATMTDALGRVTRWTYNTQDELLKVVTPSGRTMSYEYDKRGLQTRMTDGLGNAVNFSYDYRGDLVTVQDQRGYTTTFTYDKAHRPLTRRDPLGRLATVEYDAVGNVRVGTDRIGRRVTIDYDRLNRPATVHYNDATVTYNYDKKGRWTGLSDAQSTIAWEYDLANRLTKETTAQGAVEYVYFDDDQRQTLKVNGQVQSAYDYDNAGRLSHIIKGSESFTFGYDKLSRRTSLQRPNGVTTSYTYDDVYRLQRLQHIGGAVPEDLQYEYTPDDEIAKITSAYGSTQLPPTKTVGTADAANRIASYNGSNQVFDNEGQPATSGTQSYNWDARGRLTQATASGQTVGYSYDALGRRMSRTDSTGTTSFQYDGADVVMDRQGVTTVDYVNGPGMDEKLRQGGAGGTLYFQQDHLGSVIGLTGAVNERPQYEAFGRNASASATRYSYTGRERDAQTGLLYYRARWYDAGQGRFLSEDPIGMSGGLNLYSYVGNNPTNLVDPLGLYDWDAAARGFGAGLGESALVGAGFGIPLAVLAPTFPLATGIIAGALLGAGLASLALALGQWSQLCPYEQGALIGGILGGLLLGAAASRGGGGLGAGRGASPQASCPGCKIPDACFVAGTRVKTPDGEKKIEEIKAGDEVLSSDPEQGENGGGVSVQSVVRVFERTVDEVVDIHVGGETITATSEHPFWVVGRGWIASGQLERGSPLVMAEGQIVQVDSVKRRSGKFKVYNFEVGKLHTYYVSRLGVLVHNNCGPNGRPIYRGGGDLTPKPGELKNQGGMVQPKRGISHNLDPTKVDRYGGAYEVQSIPDTLKFEQIGKDPGHYELMPRQPMPLEQFLEELGKVRLKPPGS